MNRLDSMTAFVQVVELGSFAAAARRLNQSPAMVTTHIRDLEQHLGVRLLNRTTRKISLTEVGRLYYDRTVRLLADLEETEREVNALQVTPRGTLRVNSSPSFGVLQLAPAIARFCARHPEVAVELVLTTRIANLVEDAFDLAVRPQSMPMPDSSLIVRRLAPSWSVVCGAPGYFAQHGTPATPEDLVSHNCLTLSETPVYGEWHGNDWTLTGPGQDVHEIHVSGNLRANSAASLLAAAIEGQGLIMEPTFAVGAALKDGRLVQVLADYKTPEWSICAVYPPGRHLSAKVRAFVDFLVANFGQHPHWDAWPEAESDPERQRATT